jgi:hypothetical protein
MKIIQNIFSFISPTLITIILILSAALSTLYGSGLSADGAHLLRQMLSSGTFNNVSSYRIGATVLTQWPVVLAMNMGVRSIPHLAMIYTAALLFTPTACFIATTWLTRHTAPAATANVIVICCVFYPTLFSIIGEFQVLYALFWLCSVIILLIRPIKWWSLGIITVASLIMLRSYELTAVTGILLAAACIERAAKPQSSALRAIWIAISLIFLLSVPLGLQGILMPRDSSNEHGFLLALQTALTNYTLLGLVAIAAISATATLFRSPAITAGLAALSVYLSWRFAMHALSIPSYTDLLALGYQTGQRAQVFPILLGAFFVLAFSCAPIFTNEKLQFWRTWPLLIPVILVFSLYVTELQQWSRFISVFCTELSAPERGGYDTVFFNDRDVKRFGWNWELPTLSLLLRDSDNNQIISDPTYHDWQPFNPRGPVPNLNRFKQSESSCHIINNKMIAKLPALKLGARVPLTSSHPGATYLSLGWSSPESWGVWSDGSVAEIKLPSPPNGATTIVFEGHALVSPQHLKQDVTFSINGAQVAKFTLTSSMSRPLTVSIPQAARNKPLDVRLDLPDAVHPQDIGLNTDNRTLAIALEALTLR